MQVSRKGPWLDSSGPDTDVVVSCRARVARNVAGFPFVNRTSVTERQELMRLAERVVLSGNVEPQLMWVEIDDLPAGDRQLLVERHLVSRALVEAEDARAVAFSPDETLSIMVNEEDHLRIQALASGLQLGNVHARIDAVDDAIEAHLDYAFSERWGYLTACPTNVGTGIRFSVMVHLPALRITNHIEQFRRSAKDMHLAVRGFHGEGSESAGDLYQVSNQVTLGRPEEEILDELSTLIIPRIIDYERHARRVLAERSPTLLEDRVYRALAILRAARVMRLEEAMKLLSRVRLGVHLGRITGINPEQVNRLFLAVQPAHLQFDAEEHLDDEAMKIARADRIRAELESVTE